MTQGRRIRSAFALALLIACASKPASATLGGSVTSVIRHHAAWKMAHSVRAMQKYSVHQGRTPSGSVLREYVNPSGKVFAVVWDGESDLQWSDLLGEYTDRYFAAARTSRKGLHLVTANDGAFQCAVFRSTRVWMGHAVLTSAMPIGVTDAELR